MMVEFYPAESDENNRYLSGEAPSEGLGRLLSFRTLQPSQIMLKLLS